MIWLIADFKDLNRRKASDKVLCYKTFNIAENRKYDGYQCELASEVYKFFDKKLLVEQLKNEIISNKELAEELHKPIRKLEKRKAHCPFIDNIWGTDLADMQLISKFNKGFRFLLCVIDIYSKYTWVIPLKDKKGNTITYAFQKFFRWIKSQTK